MREIDHGTGVPTSLSDSSLEAVIVSEIAGNASEASDSS